MLRLHVTGQGSVGESYNQGEPTYMSIVTIVLFCLGFVLLVLGAELLVRGASQLAIAIGISHLVVGLTIVAYGTSAPEVAVTVQSVYADPPRPDLAIGNVVGSNISNVLLVLGVATLVAPLAISPLLVRYSVPFMVFVSGLLWLIGLDGEIGRIEGGVLFTGAILYTVISIMRSRRATAAAIAKAQGAKAAASFSVRRFLFHMAQIVVGLVLLVAGARWLVDGAVAVAKLLQVSELIIGLTIVAVGTSLPEIATSLVANLRGHGEIAAGNVVGSNIFNILLVLGLCALVAPHPIIVPEAAIRFDIPIMFAISLACWPIFYTSWRVHRWEGLGFLVFYVAYIVFLFLEATRHAGLQEYKTVMGWYVMPLTALVLLVLAARFWHREWKQS